MRNENIIHFECISNHFFLWIMIGLDDFENRYELRLCLWSYLFQEKERKKKYYWKGISCTYCMPSPFPTDILTWKYSRYFFFIFWSVVDNRFIMALRMIWNGFMYYYCWIYLYIFFFNIDFQSKFIFHYSFWIYFLFFLLCGCAYITCRYIFNIFFFFLFQSFTYSVFVPFENMRTFISCFILYSFPPASIDYFDFSPQIK